MSEYRVIKVEGTPPFFLEYQLLAPNGRLLIEVNQYGADSLINARDILNQETVKLQSELASLQQANAELLQVVESRSEKLGEARQFIRGTFPLEHPSDIRYANKDAAILMATWESEAVTEAAESEAE